MSKGSSLYTDVFEDLTSDQNPQFGPKNPARILPLISGSGDRRLLTEWIDQQPEYEAVYINPDSTSLTTAEFDLCILDQAALKTYLDELRNQKEAKAPVLVPYLLLYPDQNQSIIDADQGELADSVLPETVDEIVSLPIKKSELAWRVKALLRLRSQSLQLKMEERQLQRFKRAADAAGHAIYITNASGTIEYVNEAFEEITGYDKEEAVGENPRMLKSGEMSESYYKELWETVSGGEMWVEEVINRRKNGEKYTAEQAIAPINGPEGETIAFVGIQQDITERNRLEDDLREASERYKALFMSIQDAILVADIDREIINCNPAFTDLFGYELEEIEGKHTKYVYESEDEYDALGDALEGHMDNPAFSETVTYEKKSGQTFPGKTNVFYLRDASDEIIGFIGVIKDVSEIRDRVKQLQIVDRVLQHNFHNDLNVIQGYAETIETEGTPPESTFAGKIKDSAIDLAEKVDKQREITKFLSEPPSTKPIDISEQCKTAVENVSSNSFDAEISTSYPAEAMVECSGAVELAIEELLTNSIIHADSEDPKIVLKVTASSDRVSIHVIDENVRIPSMERKVLTGEEELTQLYHGNGMGLWLVHLIVNQSDGKLEFKENDPVGNIVTIHCPIADET